MTEYDYLMMKQENAFFVRPMHVAPRRHMVDSADRLGLLFAIPAGAGEGCGFMQYWPQHLAVMQNVTIYFRNNPSATFYEGCNGSLTQQQMLDMKAVRDKWDPHGGRFAGARGTDTTDVPAMEYGSPEDITDARAPPSPSGTPRTRARSRRAASGTTTPRPGTRTRASSSPAATPRSRRPTTWARWRRRPATTSPSTRSTTTARTAPKPWRSATSSSSGRATRTAPSSSRWPRAPRAACRRAAARSSSPTATATAG